MIIFGTECSILESEVTDFRVAGLSSTVMHLSSLDKIKTCDLTWDSETEMFICTEENKPKELLMSTRMEKNRASLRGKFLNPAKAHDENPGGILH